uniref:Uncharacterized protein n=1 Tax=Tetraselmis sp. GSL018 TaxID=582737 RepID=A0A061RK09_9CHLO
MDAHRATGEARPHRGRRAAAVPPFRCRRARPCVEERVPPPGRGGGCGGRRPRAAAASRAPRQSSRPPVPKGPRQNRGAHPQGARWLGAAAAGVTRAAEPLLPECPER